MTRACPHCGSPQWRDPCLYPRYAGEPPCEEIEYVEKFRARERRRTIVWWSVVLGAPAVVTALIVIVSILVFQP